MIVFDLKCPQGHRFEEWFASSDDFHSRIAGGHLRCPECGDPHLEKAIMAPRVNGGAQAPAVGPCGQPVCTGGTCAFAGS